MPRLPRPPVRVTLALAAVLFAVAVLGVGLLRAATYSAPPAAGAPWSQSARPAAGTPGTCGTVPVKATRELRGM